MSGEKDIEKVERYIRGKSNAEEISYVENLFLHGETNPDLYLHLEKDWENMNKVSDRTDIAPTHILDHVHHIIREKEDQKRKKMISRISNAYSKIAAILLLPIILAGSLTLLYLTKPKTEGQQEFVSAEIHAPFGSRISFSLPDGTTGWLNSGSNLSYSLPFTKNRQIKLQGEAWFDVAHDANNPFEISAGQSKVKVLGTSFNISAYEDEQYVEVVLKRGKIEFLDAADGKKLTIAPMERLVLKNGEITVKETDPDKYTAWTEGKLVFRSDDMAEVARRLERWYNVKIVLADKELEQFSFRATFEDDSLTEVLRLLCLTSPIEYKIIPRIQNTDGTYAKEKIILYKKTKLKKS